MGVFVDRNNNQFSELANIPQIIVESTTHTLVVKSIIITNKTPQVMRINMKLVTSGASSIENFIINEREIEPYTTLDLIGLPEIGSPVELIYSVTPAKSQKLSCFSNGTTQKYSCTAVYEILKELPFSF